jgi:hypothetical protein
MALLLKKDKAPNPANVGLLGRIAVVLHAKYGAHLSERFLVFFSHGMAPALQVVTTWSRKSGLRISPV